MGYYIKALPKKKSRPHWKVQYISYKKEDTKGSKAKKPKRERNIQKDRWRGLGFNIGMSLSEAKARAKQLNCSLHLRRQEERLQKSWEEKQRASVELGAFFPEEFVQEFENRFVRKKDSQTIQGKRNNTRSYTVWRAAQKMIRVLSIEPHEWFFNMDEFYEYFVQRKMSMRYLLSVLRVANVWGFFICRKLGQPFLPVQNPKGYDRTRIIEANFEKKNVGRASKPILPEDLKRVAKRLNSPNYNWLFLTVWLGLRPMEVDLLKKSEMWRLEKLYNGKTVLWIYQTKVIALPPEDRWKPIPILFEEQKEALKIIKSKNFKRPILQTMKRHFGVGVTTYAGRKGFPDLMLSKGQSIENISIWMGHSTIERTWRSYKSRKKFHLAGF